MKQKVAPLFSYLMIASAVFLVVWLVINNIPHYGIFSIEVTLGQSTSIISNLGPEVRTKVTDDYEAILESPIYFEVRAMPWYNKATVYVTYEPMGEHELVGLGRHIGPGFNYKVHLPQIIRDLENNNLKAVFEFNLNEFYQEKNVYRFLIDTSRHSYVEGDELRIKELKVILSL